LAVNLRLKRDFSRPDIVVEGNEDGYGGGTFLRVWILRLEGPLV